MCLRGSRTSSRILRYIIGLPGCSLLTDSPQLVEEDVTLLENQRSIPLSLKSKDIFCILPHLVVPGTLFSTRAAGLMAALSMTVGVPFLDTLARQFLGSMKGTWLNTEIPENLSYECAKLLTGLPSGVALNEEEEAVYQGMRRYRLIELNMESQLEAQVPWTPEKTRSVGDVQIQCTKCNKKRSITIMSETEDVCGLCCYEITRKETLRHGGEAAKSLPPFDVDHAKEQTEQQVSVSYLGSSSPLTTHRAAGSNAP